MAVASVHLGVWS